MSPYLPAVLFSLTEVLTSLAGGRVVTQHHKVHPYENASNIGVCEWIYNRMLHSVLAIVLDKPLDALTVVGSMKHAAIDSAGSRYS